MARVLISEHAKRELQERHGGVGLMIQPGPAHEQYQGPEWTLEDEDVAPRLRWVLLPIGNESFESMPDMPREFIAVLELEGLKVMVLFPPKTAVLKVELVNDAIRVFETDA